MSKNKVSFSFVMVITFFVLGITIFLCMVLFKLNPTLLVQLPSVDTTSILKKKDSLSSELLKWKNAYEIKHDSVHIRDTIRVPDSIVIKHDTLNIIR